MKARAQAPGVDGVRRTRWIVARNTQPQLETTTIKTWLDWFPEEVFGKMSRKPPFTHTLRVGDIECEVIFLALDKPEDVKKLLSFEVTGVWFNEAREIDADIVSAATARVGRYPSKKSMPADHDGPWPSWHGIIMDTNPPNDEHWWYKMAEEDAWAVDDFGNPKPVDEIEESKRWKFFSQPSGLSDAAENIENLPGGREYYLQQLGGKSKEWINVYVHGEYGSTVDGLPVYGDNYQPAYHRSDVEIPVSNGGVIYVGVDCSGRHPAAIFAQRNMFGQLQVIDELCVTEEQGMGAKNYAKLLRTSMAKYQNHSFEIWGDPAGQFGSQNNEETYFTILHSEGIAVKPANEALRVAPRIEAVMHMLCTFTHGKPDILISPNCKQLLRALEGGYRYRRVNTSGGARYTETPEKNRFSDVADALAYLVVGTGGLNRLYGRKRNAGGTTFAKHEFRVF